MPRFPPPADSAFLLVGGVKKPLGEIPQGERAGAAKKISAKLGEAMAGWRGAPPGPAQPPP